MGTVTGDDGLIARAEALAHDGRWDEAITLLETAERKPDDARLTAHLVGVRHRAFAALADRSPSSGPAWPIPADDLLRDASGIPEVTGAELTVELLRSAVQHRGALIVRGLVDPTDAVALRTMIDHAFEGSITAATDQGADTAPWYIPFEFEGSGPMALERLFSAYGGGVLAADSPPALQQLIDMLSAVGVRELLGEYFGERAAMSVKKTTLRRTQPDASTGWHQDGAFLGEATRSLNIWTALTPCGIDSPGLEVYPARLDHIVETGTDGAQFGWSVGHDLVARLGEADFERPVFDLGDAIMFDHMSLHRTAVDPTMTAPRYAVETWFFAPSAYPDEQIPLWL